MAEVSASGLMFLSRWRVAMNGRAANLAVFLAVGTFAYLTGSFAQMLSWQLGGIAVLCPASGIATGAMLALGRPASPYIASGAAFATALVAWEAQASIPAIALLAACNFAQCYVFRTAMTILDSPGSQLESFRSVAAFFASAMLAATVPAMPAASLTQLPWLAEGANAQELASAMFISDFFGIVIVAPVFITLSSIVDVRRRPALLLESMLALVMSVAGGVLVFMFPPDALLTVVQPAVIMFPLLLWLAARTPPFFSALGACLVALVVVAAAMHGIGRFSQFGMTEAARLTSAKLSLLTASCAVLTMSAMFARANNIADALRSSEQRLQLALAAGEMYAFDYNPHTGIVRRSGRLVDRLGLKETGSSEDYAKAIIPEDRGKLSEMLASVSQRNPHPRCQLRFALPNNDIVFVEFRSEAEFDASGRFIRLHGICVDVTDREHAREKLEEQALQLSSALDAGRVFAFEYDAADHRVRRTDNASEILGLPLEYVRRTPNVLAELVHPEDRQALRDYSSNMSPSAPFTRQTLRFIRPDGRLAWLELLSSAAFDADGKLAAIKGLARDVTEQMRAEERQKTLVRELDHRVKNALARMAVVIELSREGHTSIDDFVAVVQGRIRSMAKTQERLSSSAWAGIDVNQIVGDE